MVRNCEFTPNTGARQRFLALSSAWINLSPLSGARQAERPVAAHPHHQLDEPGEENGEPEDVRPSRRADHNTQRVGGPAGQRALRRDQQRHNRNAHSRPRKTGQFRPAAALDLVHPPLERPFGPIHEVPLPRPHSLPRRAPLQRKCLLAEEGLIPAIQRLILRMESLFRPHQNVGCGLSTGLTRRGDG